MTRLSLIISGTRGAFAGALFATYGQEAPACLYPAVGRFLQQPGSLSSDGKGRDSVMVEKPPKNGSHSDADCVRLFMFVMDIKVLGDTFCYRRKR